MGITKARTKLGNILTWNVRAVDTCPGASEGCLEWCYALNGHFRFANVKSAHDRNLEASKQDGWVDQMVKDIDPDPFRVHVAGDFYSERYVLDWIRIAQRTPDTQYWAYTKSWRVPELMPTLETLRAQPNFQLFASWDESMPEPPPEGWRIAAMDGEVEGYRCPEQDRSKVGGPPPSKESCLDCGYCFKGKKNNVTFMEH